MTTTPTTTRDEVEGRSNRRRRRLAWRLGLVGTAVLAVPATAFAIGSLSVAIPFLPVVGESTAQACDSDGVSTSFTYGNTSAKGIKVTAVTVADISSDCQTATVDFMSGETTVDTYTGSVSTSTVTLSTNIFTNTFTSVRILLNP